MRSVFARNEVNAVPQIVTSEEGGRRCIRRRVKRHRHSTAETLAGWAQFAFERREPRPAVFFEGACQARSGKRITMHGFVRFLSISC